MSDKTEAVAEEEVELIDSFGMMIEAMRMNGITNMYGIPGIPITALIRGWQAEGLKFFAFRHETSAGMAASVEGYLTGVPGVCLTTPAPGFLNGLAAAANATQNGWPMILMSGGAQRRNTDLGQGAFEELDQLQVARPLVKAAFRINNIRDIPVAMARAVRTAVSGRPGAVFIDLSHEMLPMTLPLEEGKRLLFTPVDPAPRQLPAPDAIQRAADLLKGAKKPLILLGKGAAYAKVENDVKALVEEYNIPFLPMSMAKGLISDAHPLCAGAVRSFVLPAADVVLLVGARLNWLLGNGQGPTWGNQLKKFIQIDIKADEIDSNVPIAAPLVGDIVSTIGLLREAVKGMAKAPSEWTDAIAQRVSDSRTKLGDTLYKKTEPGMMNYRNSLGAIRDVLAKYPNVTLVNEGANALDNTRMIVDQYQPRRRIDSGTWGIMGIGLGACIAAAVVTNEPVVAVEGDSAFGFSGMEVETIVRYNLPVTVLVMNNGGIYKGNEVNPGDPNHPAATMFAPGSRYDKMIEAFGGVGMNATTPEELSQMLDTAINSRKPTMINVVLDPDAGVESGRIQGLNIVRKGKK